MSLKDLMARATAAIMPKSAQTNPKTPKDKQLKVEATNSATKPKPSRGAK